MNEPFQPQAAMNTLRKNALAIGKLGESIHNTRIKFIVAKAALMDVENLSRRLLLKDETIKVTAFREHLKDATAEQQKEHDILLEELRGLKEDLEILIEVNNSTKACIRIAEMEAKYLNLDYSKQSARD